MTSSMINQQNAFVRMVIHAFGGALLGLLGGLILGYIIQAFSFALISGDMGDGPWHVAAFLGMGSGSIIGAVLGGLVGIKK